MLPSISPTAEAQLLMDISLASAMARPPLNVDMNKKASSLGVLKHNVPLQRNPRGGLEGFIYHSN
ncbi:hypothetical protein NC653_015978 [Populus alba x Populus x berolinensis]|uniref:Uncharacterized protein n=1 Tax=Populus alba x Populus x berolinensis TaxID=444605 RepID=A0AAD6QLP6_9ROSI|nr:hypothetical protein NC653_015969 [Populus alba x Populus x berolinensis]KAJ6992741.1 hypothetical protein NC653_015978 [Populus alba x Populus x berolinensis]